MGKRKLKRQFTQSYLKAKRQVDEERKERESKYKTPLEKEAKRSVEERGDFLGAFLGWLIDYRQFKGRDISYVLEKMWKYEPEIDEWWEMEKGDYE